MLEALPSVDFRRLECDPVEGMGGKMSISGSVHQGLRLHHVTASLDKPWRRSWRRSHCLELYSGIAFPDHHYWHNLATTTGFVPRGDSAVSILVYEKDIRKMTPKVQQPDSSMAEMSECTQFCDSPHSGETFTAPYVTGIEGVFGQPLEREPIAWLMVLLAQKPANIKRLEYATATFYALILSNKNRAAN
ncbi:hypothetical protein BJ165DRAFT_1411351 [Panaeolus papilionaceus]|nr:hypothetical protein BJ165DRAFT_1411351 [Panaeolus papilionaceus]